ncbi:MAG: hypothetical protein M1423_02580, partial [Acidobacteria bacterium]|nr:hypothetical protein [Acidobacteriota bacterium]
MTRLRFQPRPQPERGRRSRAAKVLSVLLAAAGALIAGSAARGAPPRARVIWTFNHSLTNTLGGGYNVFSRDPSWARSYLDAAVHRPQSGHSLRITAHRAIEGFCGVWFDFYPANSSPKRYFDARAYPYLAFWIKGQKPGGDFDIKLVDSRGESHEGAAATRPLHDYLAAGITTRWQKVTIPLADFTETDPGSLARMVFIFNAPGDYEFYVDDVSFDSSLDASGWAPEATDPQPARREDAAPYHSMWVWKTAELLNNPQAANRLFDFCARTGLEEIYLSVDFDTSPGHRIPVSIPDAPSYGAFLEAAHKRGLRVEALAGAPVWAATAYHARALGAVRAILELNARMPSEGRFDGIHFDVEPYLLLGFAVPGYRKRLLEEYLEMVAQCSAAARKGQVTFTCDIPWWFFPASPAARQQFTVPFNGTEKTVGEHVADLLDSVTIMDYRNEADGSGGIITFGIPALAYAAKVRKTVRIGLETSAEKPTVVTFAVAVSTGTFFAKLRQKRLENQRSFEGYAMHALRADGSVFIGLGPLLHSKRAPDMPMEVALDRLRKLFGAKFADRFTVENEIVEVRSAVADDPEWQNFELVELQAAGRGRKVEAFQAVRCTPPITTFHGLGRKVFREETRSAADWLDRYSSFGGLAVHYYQSFQ